MTRKATKGGLVHVRDRIVWGLVCLLALASMAGWAVIVIAFIGRAI